MNTETPRTDAYIERLLATCPEPSEDEVLVPDEWPRTLELEIIRLTMELTAVRACFAEASQDNAKASSEIARLRQALEMAESWGESGIESMDAETAKEFERLKA